MDWKKTPQNFTTPQKMQIFCASSFFVCHQTSRALKTCFIRDRDRKSLWQFSYSLVRAHTDRPYSFNLFPLHLFISHPSNRILLKLQYLSCFFFFFTFHQISNCACIIYCVFTVCLVYSHLLFSALSKYDLLPYHCNFRSHFLRGRETLTISHEGGCDIEINECLSQLTISL